MYMHMHMHIYGWHVCVHVCVYLCVCVSRGNWRGEEGGVVAKVGRRFHGQHPTFNLHDQRLAATVGGHGRTLQDEFDMCAWFAEEHHADMRGWLAGHVNAVHLLCGSGMSGP